MSAAIDWSRLDGALSLGLSRQPLPPTPGLEALDEPARALAVLALLGQRGRLAPLATPPDIAADARLPDDARPMLDGPARAALLRMDPDTRQLMARLILGAITGAGRRLHVFDLARLESLLHPGDKALSPVERAWLGHTEVAATGPAGRLAAFRQARRADPAAARDALTASLPTEPAKVRADLIGALDTGLSIADVPLLEACLTDRAQSVREAARTLLARLLGSPAYDERLARVRASLTIGTKGLLRRSKRLIFTPPADNPHLVNRLFEGFGLLELVEGLPIEIADLPDAAEDAQPALRLLARAALLDGDPALAAAFLLRIADPVWPRDVLDLPLTYDVLPPETWHAVLAASLSRESRFDPPPPGYGISVYLDGPMRPELVHALITSPGWHNFLARIADRDDSEIDHSLLAACAAVPPATAAAVAATLTVIPAARRPKTTALLAFLMLLADTPAAETPIA